MMKHELHSIGVVRPGNTQVRNVIKTTRNITMLRIWRGMSSGMHRNRLEAGKRKGSRVGRKLVVLRAGRQLPKKKRRKKGIFCFWIAPSPNFPTRKDGGRNQRSGWRQEKHNDLEKQIRDHKYQHAEHGNDVQRYALGTSSSANDARTIIDASVGHPIAHDACTIV